MHNKSMRICAGKENGCYVLPLLIHHQLSLKRGMKAKAMRVAKVRPNA